MLTKQGRTELYQKWMREFESQNTRGNKRPVTRRAEGSENRKVTTGFTVDYRPPTIPHDFVALDLETTGFSQHKNKIIEVAAIKVRNLKPVDHMSHLVRLPDNEQVPPFIQELTGITDHMLETDGVDISTAITSLSAFIRNETLIIHNAPFDTRFLKVHMPLPNPVVCSLALARQALPHMESHSLSFLKECLGSDVRESHRALADCYAVIDVIRACKKMC